MNRLIAGLGLIVASSAFCQSSLPTFPEIGNTITIAGAVLPWESRFILSGNQAQSRRDSRCAFSFSYELINPSAQTMSIQSTAVFIADKPLHLGQAMLLPAGKKKNISGRIYLPNGTNVLQFSVETAQGVVNKTVAVQLSGC